MKTLIFCTSYISSQSKTNNKKRYERWINYYLDKIDLFGADSLLLIDDGSPEIPIENLDAWNISDLPETFSNRINLVGFEDNLGRLSQNDYKGWWRSFTSVINIADKYNFDKIIHIESDFFILSDDMIDYIKDLSYGWTTFYSRFHRFPESAIQIICKDEFPALRQCHHVAIANDFSMNAIAERYLPFTHIEKQFYGDRLGQFDVFDGWLKWITTPFKLDYIGQILPDFSVEDYEDFFEFNHKWS